VHRLVTALVAALGAFALVAAVLVLPAPAGRASADASMTIRLTSTASGGTRVTDAAPRGPSRGDKLRVRSVLRNAVAQFGKPKGAVVGSDQMVVTLLTPTSASATVAVKLPGGTMRLRGRLRLDTTSGPTSLPVVGGTGRFAGAKGRCVVRDQPAFSTNVYHLTLP
jgi:hypothetical protein